LQDSEIADLEAQIALINDEVSQLTENNSLIINTERILEDCS
jgi:hypothetical protein